MSYKVEFTLHAEEDLARFDKTIAQHTANKIDWLSQSMGSINPTPLKGKFKGKYKLRVGDWRVIITLSIHLRLLLSMLSGVAEKFIRYESQPFITLIEKILAAKQNNPKQTLQPLNDRLMRKSL